MLTNAPRDYTLRVIGALGIGHLFHGLLTIEDMRMFGQWRPKPDVRMFRRLLARLRVPASSVTLVEDTLEHQKAARSLGMRTAWIQRWTRRAGPGPASASARCGRCSCMTSRVSRCLRASWANWWCGRGPRMR